MAISLIRMLAVLLLVLVSSPSRSQSYPQRPITIISGFPAGTAVDLTARLAGQAIAAELGQQVIVETRTGASGAIAAERVAKSAPDGYTLLLVSAAHTALPALRDNLPYDQATDFTPISPLSAGSFVVLVNADSPARSLQDLIKLAKDKPNTLRYASSGIGTVAHLAAEQFLGSTGIRIEHIPYKGATEATLAVASGGVDLTFTTLAAALPYLKPGAEKLRLLATTAATRSPLIPDLPTIGESGVPGYDRTGWYGLSGPAGMPPAIVDRLNRALTKAFSENASIREALATQGLDPRTSSPQAFAKFLDDEMRQNRQLIQAAGIRLAQ